MTQYVTFDYWQHDYSEGDVIPLTNSTYQILAGDLVTVIPSASTTPADSNLVMVGGSCIVIPAAQVNIADVYFGSYADNVTGTYNIAPRQYIVQAPRRDSIVQANTVPTNTLVVSTGTRDGVVEASDDILFQQ